MSISNFWRVPICQLEQINEKEQEESLAEAEKAEDLGIPITDIVQPVFEIRDYYIYLNMFTNTLVNFVELPMQSRTIVSAEFICGDDIIKYNVNMTEKQFIENYTSFIKSLQEPVNYLPESDEAEDCCLEDLTDKDKENEKVEEENKKNKKKKKKNKK